jgi:5-methylcytosine-specific restriction endonuclease McrA
MPRRPFTGTPEIKRQRLISLLEDFEVHLSKSDLRRQVQSLVPVFHELRDLGSSLLGIEGRIAARDRILSYLRRYPSTIIAGDELLVVSGIQEYARRIRELRVEFGWPILSGKAIRDLFPEERSAFEGVTIHVDDYILLRDQQDREAALRWNIANEIRRSTGSVKDKILRYFQANVGTPVTAEELRYIAKDRSEWARRVRELRTEEGWNIATQMTERPDLPPGVYVMENRERAEPHDRAIPEDVRIEVLQRDQYSCRCAHCDFDARNPPPGPRRRLELHHVIMHASKGGNDAENLVTLCNVHHDAVHAGAALKLKQLP